MKEPKQRTNQQNKSLYVYFTNLADTLNLAGLDQSVVLSKTASVSWTPETVKLNLFKPLMIAITSKGSTADLTTQEIQLVYENLNRHLSETHGVTEAWPSIEEQMLQSLISNN